MTVAPWYVMAYIKLDRVAMRHGYALALHGSMARDLDLIAIPWTEDADPPAKLMESIRRFVVTEAHDVRLTVGPATKKPHGRLAYFIPIGHKEHGLDISIMPRKRKRNKR